MKSADFFFFFAYVWSVINHTEAYRVIRNIKTQVRLRNTFVFALNELV